MNRMSAPRAQLNLLDLQRWSDLWDVPFHFPTGHPRRTVEAMRLLTGLDGADRIRMTHRLYRAYWIEGLNLADREVLDGLVRDEGLDPAIIDTPAAKVGLFATTELAVQNGAFGVPAFVVDGTMWWGQDRLNFVETALGGQASPPVSKGSDRPSKIRFFHDFASPFSYLAATQIERVAQAHDMEIEWCPILLGALFRSIGTPDVPLFEMSAPKQAYVRRDLYDWAAWWGTKFEFPSHFPIRTVAALRVAIAEPALTIPLYRAAWADDRPIDDPAVLADIIDAEGFDSDAILSRIQTADVKQVLRDNTALAESAGACGVPSFQVLYNTPGRDPLMIWGQDRIHMLEQALAGWHPACG